MLQTYGPDLQKNTSCWFKGNMEDNFAKERKVWDTQVRDSYEA